MEAAARYVGEALLNSTLGTIYKMLISPLLINFIQRKKLNRKQVEKLETILKSAQAVINDAERREIKEEAVKDWMDRLKDAVYDTEDLLDEVTTKAAIHKENPGNSLSCYVNLHQHDDGEIANWIEEVIERIEYMVKQIGTLGLREIPKENMSWRITTSLGEMSDVYGREEDKEAIVRLLLDDADTGDGDISVIPIVGMGGIGKTTLTQLIYHDNRVKQNFDFQAWVCVSQEFDVMKVTKNLLEATKGPCNLNNLDLLQHDLKDQLSRRKFFVVLDDAWNDNPNEWKRLLQPFRDGIKGSKILMTTRNEKVANAAQNASPYELGFLSEENCWLVFSKHARLSTASMEYSDLEKVGRDIVKKCDGLPLAAQALGGLLSGNSDVNDWNRVLKSEIWEFPHEVAPALQISYYYLPSYLKDCFVYCSLFPKDYVFDKDELILLWMAESFLRPGKNQTPEEAGDKYYNELIARSFFQPHSTLQKKFVMHDLIHDMAMFFAGKFYFRAEEPENVENVVEIDGKTRHLSHNAKGNYPISKLLRVFDNVKHTRTFLEINLDPRIPFNMENAPCILLSKLKYLRALSFKYFPLESLPDSIGELIHLRHLDLSWTYIVTLPESLGNLYNLQTLKLVGCSKLKMLPLSMKNLVNLRHLDIRDTWLLEMPKGMDKLKSLRFLSN